MSLLTVKLGDIYFIDCGKRGSFKREPRYRPFILLPDSFLIGNHEVCLTYKQIFGGYFVTSKMFVKGKHEFFKLLFRRIFEHSESEDVVDRLIDTRGEQNKVAVSIRLEGFDEVKFSSITELKLRRNYWAGVRTIDVTYQDGSISFTACAFTPWGVLPIAEIVQKIFEYIQIGVNTYRRH